MSSFFTSRLARALPTAAAAAVLLAVAGQAIAAPADDRVEKIVAVVNDEAISEGDLNGALRLAMVAGNFPDTPEIRDRLTPEVLRTLIDDQIKLQEAKRLKVRVDKNEVDTGLRQVAEQSNATVERFQQELSKQGIPLSTIERQTRSRIAWQKVLQKEVGPRIDLGTDEIEAAYDQMLASIDKPQFAVAEIFLVVDTPAKDASVLEFAEQLEERLRHGANFGALAQQFSQAAGAAQGGFIGVVQEGELGDAIDQQLRKLTPGQVSSPVRTEAGYHIVLLQDKGNVLQGDPREASVHLKNVLVPYRSQPTKETLPKFVAEAQPLRATLTSCAALDDLAKRDSLAGDLGKPDQMFKVGDLAPLIGNAVAALRVNQVSQPIPTPDGIQFFMVCQRTDPPKREAPTKEMVQNQLWGQRMDKQQQRYLRDLRSAAFIDVRV